MTPSQITTLENVFSCFLIDSDLRWKLVDIIPNLNDKECRRISSALTPLIQKHEKLIIQFCKKNLKEAKKLILSIQNIKNGIKKKSSIRKEQQIRKKEKNLIVSLETQINTL